MQITKIGGGGEQLSNSWNPNTPGTRYLATLESISSSTCRKRGLILFLGTNDARLLSDAEAFEQNLRDFVAGVHSVCPNLPILVFQNHAGLLTTGPAARPFNQIVRDAKEAVASDTDCVTLVNIDDADISLDQVHLNDPEGEQVAADAIVNWSDC